MDHCLNDALYIRFRNLLQQRCGLFYPEQKRADLLHGLNLAIGVSGHQNLEELYQDIVDKGPAWDIVLAHLTIGETSFFRNRPQFEALRQHILPELFKQRASSHTMRIWSAGCASGEEPYSIAMLLTDMLPHDTSWTITILATDINPHFLSRAREALYGEWSFRDLDEQIKQRFFTSEQRRWRLNSDIRRMVHFSRLNLVEPCYPSIANGTFALDMILCRNVTIYFEESTTRQIIERFYRALVPGGWLIVGHAEPQSSIYHQFEAHNFPNAVVYRKPLNTPLFIVDPQFAEGKSKTVQTEKTKHQVEQAPISKIPAPQAPAVSVHLSDLTPEVKRNPQPPRPDLWLQVRALLQQGKKQAAEPMLHDLLAAQPDHSDAHLALARLSADSGDWELARTHAEQTIDLDPLRIEAHYLLAQVYEHLGQDDDALACYRRTVYLDRTFVMGILGMAHTWHRLGRFSEARRNYRNALKQLHRLSPSEMLLCADGSTAQEITSYINRQLQTVPEV
ncbi:MAG: tetratricopeptide repeat protein [Chloroflexaceae bacterium]|nr:tetratricopeptide repeat protein [Chloroflexaceae bacterium]